MKKGQGSLTAAQPAGVRAHKCDRDMIASFLTSAQPSEHYVPQSLEFNGILKQMLDEMNAKARRPTSWRLRKAILADNGVNWIAGMPI